MMSMAKKVDPMEAAAKRAAEEVTKKAKAAKQAADAAKTKSIFSDIVEKLWVPLYFSVIFKFCTQSWLVT